MRAELHTGDSAAGSATVGTLLPPRSTARGALVALLLLLGPASLAAAPPKAHGVPKLIFPVVGPVSYSDDFGDPRGTGRHEGNDLVAGKRQLAVAVEAAP